jgi:hypothetical protein
VVVWLSLERPREAMMLSLVRVWRAVARAPRVGSVSHRVALRSAVVQGVAKGLAAKGLVKGVAKGGNNSSRQALNDHHHRPTLNVEPTHFTTHSGRRAVNEP